MRIPRVFHRIWTASSPLMPDEFVRWGRTWLNLNPNWDMIEWHNWPEWGVNREAYESARNAAQAADVLRYEVLAKFGGIYVDTDFEALKPIEEAIGDVGCFAASEFSFNNDAQPRVVSAGIIGATPEHPAILDAIAALPGSMQSNTQWGQSFESGPWFLTSVYVRHVREFKVFPKEAYYPYYLNEPNLGPEAYPQAVAVHHWAASWV